jgi:hypothetical protein
MLEEDSLEMVRDDLPILSPNEQEKPNSQKSDKTLKIPDWLPDWKTMEGYPDPNGTVSKEQWAWEFIRRNPRYQYLYRIGRRHKESWYNAFPDSDKFSRYFKCIPKVNKDESYGDYIVRCKLDNVAPKIIPKQQRILAVFPVVKYSKKLNPANTKPPEFNKDYGYPICNTVSDDEEEITFSIDGDDEVFMVFSAALPVKAQIEKAERLLFEQQKYYEEQGNHLVHKGRVQFHPLRNYLRYLDGKISGASQVEIARIVHPNEYEYSAKQKVNKGIKAGEYLRDIGYLKILGTENLK